MDMQTLQGAVAEEFATTSAATPPWPDPHPRGAAPLETEYSRCLDPGKYRILRARADAWVRTLTGLGLAAVEEVDNPAAAWRDCPSIPLDTGYRLRPFRAGTISLLMGFRSLDDVPDAIVVVGAGEPAVQLISLPVCGCDACDDGSDYLLDEFDEHVLAVVTGDFMHVATKQGTITATGSGCSASGWSASAGPELQQIETILNDARIGRSPHHVLRGAAWA